MKINFCSNNGYKKILKPIKISQDKITNERYTIKDESDQYLGKFKFEKDENGFGHISSLEIMENLRRKKTAFNILFSVKKFIEEEAEKKQIDTVFFFASKQNYHNLIKLYKKIVPNAIIIDNIDFAKFIVLKNDKDEKKVRDAICKLNDQQQCLDNIYFENFFEHNLLEEDLSSDLSDLFKF